MLLYLPLLLQTASDFLSPLQICQPYEHTPIITLNNFTGYGASLKKLRSWPFCFYLCFSAILTVSLKLRIVEVSCAMTNDDADCVYNMTSCFVVIFLTLNYTYNKVPYTYIITMHVLPGGNFVVIQCILSAVQVLKL